MKQGTFSIVNYFGKMKILWDELDVANDDDCLCSVCFFAQSFSQTRKTTINSILYDLNETFTIIRSILLMLNTLATLNYAYSVLI